MASETKLITNETKYVGVKVPEGVGEETRRKSHASKLSHPNRPQDTSSCSETQVKGRVSSRPKRGDEHCLSRAIQANATKLADILPFKDCELADEVVKRGCVTEDECKALREKRDRKTQVRAIILLVKRRSYGTMEQFLDAAKIHCPLIVDCIWQQYHKNVNENQRFKRPCPLCNMKSSVDVRRVLDELWSAEVINDTLVEKINSDEEVVGLQDEHWDGILDACCKNSTKGLPTLYKALETHGHYKHIAKELRFHFKQNERLFCTCSSFKTCYGTSRTSSFNSGTTVEPASSYYDSDLTEIDFSCESDTKVDAQRSDSVKQAHNTNTDKVICPHLNDQGKRSEGGSCEAKSSASVKGISRTTCDQPRQFIREKRQEKNQSWFRKFVLFCGKETTTFSTPIEEEIES